jgi:predicted esterase
LKYPNSPFQDKLPGNNYRLVFFNGPKMPVTMFGGEEHPSWYDALKLPVNDPKRGNIDHAIESLDEITQFIKGEHHKYYAKSDRPRIFVSGFSQGACMAMLAGIVSIFDLVQEDADFLNLKAKSISCPPLAGVHVTAAVVLP